MARINFPDSFAAQRSLLDSLSTKHTADGASSDLAPYLAQKDIDLPADVAAGTQAAVHEKARSLHSKSAENYRQLRDNRFDPVFARLRDMVQFLKGLNRGAEKALGDWGIQVDNKSKIVYPTDFDAQAALYSAFAQKHGSYSGATSPLNPYLSKHNISIASDLTAISNAADSHAGMKAAAKSAEDEKELRDNLWQPVVTRLRGSIDYLKRLNSDNPKALGAYGVTVDDSPRAPKLRTTTLKIGEQITNNGVSIGGTFTNLGTGDLHVYRGKTTTGTPTIVHAGEQLGMLKGWSTITVVNPSTLVVGKFSVLVSNG